MSTTHAEFSSEEKSRMDLLTKKNFKKLMPLLVIVYIISFVDRTNIGMAKEALQAGIGLRPRCRSVLPLLCRARDPLEPDHAQNGCSLLDRPNHGHLGHYFDAYGDRLE